MNIYADFNGSAPLSDDVKEYLIHRIQNGPFANPNAIHQVGARTLMAMEKSRKLISDYLGAKPNQIIFNSGATEGITNIFYTFTRPEVLNSGKKHIITSSIEHSAVLNETKRAKSLGFTTHYLPVNEDGIVEVEKLNELLGKYSNETALVSIMAANNETGVIQPIDQISKICKEYSVPFFSDTTQYIGKTSFNFNELGLDYAVMSGHKIGALTGCGFIIAKDPSTLECLILGGGQEKGRRGGTQNYLGNESIAVALKSIHDNFDKIGQLANKRAEFENKIKTDFPNVVILGDKAPRLASTTYIAFPGIHGQGVQIELESKGIFVTTSSACSDNEPVTSKVLKAMNVSDDIGRGVVRISLCLCSNLSDYDKIYDALKETYIKLGKLKSF